MTFLDWLIIAAGALGWAFLIGWAEQKFSNRRARPLEPEQNGLDCGQCFWLVEAAFPENRELRNLVDQLYISPWCEVHNTFGYKRWNEKHLDDAPRGQLP